MGKWILLVAVMGLTGCQGQHKPSPPLQDTGVEVAPPRGCVELRERGGAC